jgi:hypothetical protein
MAFFDPIFNFIMQNLWLLVGIGLLAFVIMTYLKVRSKISYKVIDRKEIERLNFVEDMRFNKTNRWKWLIKGDRVLGKIENYLEFTHTGNPETKAMIGMVIKPMLITTGIRLSNPFSKSQPFLLENNDKIVQIRSKKEIIIPEFMGSDNIFGYYYAIDKDSKSKIENVIDYHLLKTDFNLQASRYFVKSQEQCVYSPEMALELAKKEKEIQLELAKKRGKSESI